MTAEPPTTGIDQSWLRFGIEGGWGEFEVVRFHSVEEISRPFLYEIILLRRASRGPADLDALLDAPASLAISTEKRWRLVHGIVAEAEELERTHEVLLYRVLLVPHFYRARFRRSCRNFVGRPLMEVLSLVLENVGPLGAHGPGGLTRFTGDSVPADTGPDFRSYTPPLALYRWMVIAEDRFNDVSRRKSVAQYNESDFDFFSRLLEDEGVGYQLEHGDNCVVMTITDHPGRFTLFPNRDRRVLYQPVHRGDGMVHREVVLAYSEARRLSSRSVRLRDYSWARSNIPLEGQAAAGSADATQRCEHFEFPALEESVTTDPCVAPAEIRLQRFEAERAMGSGQGTVRTLEAGEVATVHDVSGLRPDEDLLVVRVEAHATQSVVEGTVLDRQDFGALRAPQLPGAYENVFSVLPASLRFRPAIVTPKPIIAGVQSAIVNAEEILGDPPEIHTDAWGCVRVRFPWDETPVRADPTSIWMRVSQYWAGAGFGAIFTPRVGQEVLVAYEQGNPDRPVIVGRVFNGQNPVPHPLPKDKTISTVRTRSTPKSHGFNEIRFQDLVGKEEIYVHAQNALDEVVLGSHSTSVGGDQSNTVAGNRTAKVQKNQETVVGINNSIAVLGDEDRHVTGNETYEVGRDESIEVKGTRHTKIIGQDSHYAAGYDSTVGGNHEFQSSNTYFTTGDFQVKGKTAAFWEETQFLAKGGGAQLVLAPGRVWIDNGAGAGISIVGSTIILYGTTIAAGATGGPVVLKGSSIEIDGGEQVNAKAGVIKLNE